MSHEIPLISEESAGYLARLINRAAASFDVAALSPEEAIEAYVLLDRVASALWREHKQVLLPLYQSLVAPRIVGSLRNGLGAQRLLASWQRGL